MVQETVTAEVEIPTPSEAVEEPTSQEAAPEATPDTPAATAKFGFTDDPYEVIDHEDLKPVLERKISRERDTIRAELDTEFAEKTRKWESTQSYQTISGHMGRVLQAIEDGNLEGAARTIERLEGLMAPHAEEQVKEYRTEGASGAANHMWGLLKDSLKGADTRTQDEFDDLGRSGASWPKIFDAYVEARTSKMVREHKSEMDSLKLQIEELKTGVRGSGPNGAATAGSTAGGGKLYSQMTAEERAALTPAERDALVARELGG